MRRVVVLAGAIVFVDTLFFAALTPLLPHYAHRYELTKAGAGLLAACYPLGVLAGGIPGGIAATRFGVKRTAIVALLVIAGASIAFGWGESIVLLDLVRFAQGVGSAFAWTAALAWLVSETPTSRRGEVIGSALGVAIGGAVFGPVLGAVASVTGTGPAFSAVGVLCVLLVFGALRTPAPALKAEQAPGRFLVALRDRRILGGLWLVMLPGILFGTQSVLVPLRLSELGFGAVAIGAVYLCATALEAGAAPLVGRVSDRRGRRLPIVAALLGSAVVGALLPWPDSGVLLALLAIVAAVVFGIVYTPTMSMLTDRAERIGLDVAWAFALINLAWAPGQALGALGGGSLARATSDAVSYLLLSGLCLATAVAVRRG